MGLTWVAPASAICRTVDSSWAGESDRNGTTGPISTPQRSPCSLSVAQTPSRRLGLGVPGSMVRHRSSSAQPTDTLRPTSVTSADASSRSRSRRISVPLVRMEYGLRASSSAWRIPGISWYLPSARW